MIKQILRHRDDYALIETDASYQPYVVAYKYDPASNGWAQGHYFCDREDAERFYSAKQFRYDLDRMIEIAEKAIGYISSLGNLPDFCEAEEIDLADYEQEYFNIP